MSSGRPNAFRRLSRGETSYEFVGRWRIWFAISAVVILAGLISLGTQGLNFSIDFKGGTIWEVPTSASVSDARAAIGDAVPGFGQSVVQQLTNTETGQKAIQVKAAAKYVGDSATVQKVTDALAKMAHVSPNDVQLNEIGPSWGSDITDKAVEAVFIFLAAVTIYIWLRFEGKMAAAALIALVHDILVTIGIYSISGFQVSPDTVIAFLTVLGYSLYDTIVVFDRVQENTRGLASTNRMTYSDTVNLSINQVLARSLNTSLVAILPILSILVIGAWTLGATALEDFGLALFIGLTTGAYSSIFIASPVLALFKEREPRYAEIRRRLEQSRPQRLTPAAVAGAASMAGGGAGRGTDTMGAAPADGSARAPRPARRRESDGGSGGAVSSSSDPAVLPPEVEYGSAGADPSNGRPAAPEDGAIPLRQDVPPRSGSRPPPRPRKKGRRR
jgi:preprotein translocase subunit SecF